jgi:hypothetical protein
MGIVLGQRGRSDGGGMRGLCLDAADLQRKRSHA